MKDVSVSSLKEQGNDHFKAGSIDDALACYTQAIDLCSDDKLLPILLKNRAAANLTKDNFQSVIEDCTKVLDWSPNDPKALYRRCLALEQLGRFKEAFKDGSALLVADPKNKQIQPVMQRLHGVVQKELDDSMKLSSKVSLTFKFVFDTSADQKKRIDSANNMLVLSRESSGKRALIQENVHMKIRDLFIAEKNGEILLACVRTLTQLCTDNAEITCQLLRDLSVTWLVDLLNRRQFIAESVSSAQYLLQTILNTLASMDVRKDKPSDTSALQRHKKEIDSVMSVLCVYTNYRAVTPEARDAILELLLRNCPYRALNWSANFVDAGGVQRLMEVASEYSGVSDSAGGGGGGPAGESRLELTASTKAILSVCFSTLYDDMMHDKARQQFIAAAEDFIKSKLITPEIEGKVRVAAAITVLMQGPVDVGNSLLGKEGILEMMLIMANTDDLVQQRVACEAIISAASKKDKCKSIISQGVNILKQLYLSSDDSIRVRALVGLCKLGSVGGTDAVVRPFADGSTMKLADACRRFLVNPSKDMELRRWATEGLSYLTLDAEVKEKLVEDTVALHAMLELARTGDHSMVYGVITTLVNLTNSYDKQEVIPEMLELAKFAKQHIPETHELDDEDFVIKRIEILAKQGGVSALVALTQTESKNCRELIARVFNAMCGREDLRGLIVQQGGCRALLSIALDCTDKGKKQAGQALSRLAISIDPATAFPGQRSCEVVRPLLAMLHPDCSALENFESLLGLCNLCGMNETVRQRVIKEKGIHRIEQYMYEEHVQLRRAATQCITNMIASPDFLRLLEAENDRLKFLLLLVGEEDQETSMAAAGALAMATGASQTCCSKILDVKSWHEMFRVMLANPSEDIRLRGVVTTLNLICAEKRVAEAVVETDITEILMALTKVPPESDITRKIIATAEKALKEAETRKLIRPAGADSDSSDE